MFSGARIRVNTHSFCNDMQNFKTKDDVLTLLIHLGYLAYDLEEQRAFIPNKEISWEFENAMSVGGWTEVMRVLKASERLLEDTLRCDGERVAAGLDLAHITVRIDPDPRPAKHPQDIRAQSDKIHIHIYF